MAQEKSMDAVALLKADHKKVKALFDDFEDAKSQKEKLAIAQEAIQELKVHATVEEELFYPQVREAVGEEEGIFNEAEEEHHVAKTLIAELEKMGLDEEHFEAKFIVLAENVRHHIKEEEGQMLPEAKKSKLDMDALGEQMRQRKEELRANGVPESKEEKLLAHAG